MAASLTRVLGVGVMSLNTLGSGSGMMKVYVARTTL